MEPTEFAEPLEALRVLRAQRPILQRAPNDQMIKFDHRVSWQRIRYQCVSRDNRDELLAIAIGVRERVGVPAALQLRDPQLTTGFCVERAESIVVGAADEDQPTASDNRSSEHRPSGVLFRFRQLIGDTERPLPREITGGCIDRDEPAPWRLLTRPALTVDTHVERAVHSALLVRDRETLFGLFKPA